MSSYYDKEFLMEPISLADIASRYNLNLIGEDLEIRAMGMLGHRTRYRAQQLTFAVTSDYLKQFFLGDIGACIAHEKMIADCPEGRAVLVTDKDPEEVFYTIFADSVEEGRWPQIEQYMGVNTFIAPSATVHQPVQIGDNCTIMDNVVIFPNTHLGNGVVIKPNSVIGGYGWEARTIHGKRRVPPHAGGVWIEDDVSIGSCTCIDRGLFGDFTYIGAETLIDNLIHIAHSCTLGWGCKIVACCEISGNVILGKNVWLGPNTSVINHISIGDNCFVGIGSTVVRSLPPNTLAYGNPARVHGWVCDCRQKLDFENHRAVCKRCFREYNVDEGQLIRVAS